MSMKFVEEQFYKRNPTIDQAYAERIQAQNQSYHKLKIEDDVNSPAHYTMGNIEVIEAIEDWGLNYHRGNAVKYIARAGRKDPSKEIEDLKKAAWFIQRDIVRLENVSETTSNKKQETP